MSSNGIIHLMLDDELVKLSNFEDIQKREKFVKVFDPKGKELVKIIGSYEFENEIHCGLKDCNQPHKKGFVVLTSTDEETNIGNRCGIKIFGHTQFSSLRKDYKIKFDAENNKRTLVEAVVNIDQWYERLISQYNKNNKNARWAWETANNALNPSVIGNFACDELNNMKRTLNGNVVVDRHATKKESEYLEEQGKKPPYFIEVHLGEIKHISGLSQALELRELLLTDIKETLEILSNMKPAECSDYNILAHVARRVNSIEANFNKIDSAVENAIKFFSKENLKPLYIKLTEHYSGFDKSRNIKALTSFFDSL